MARILLIDDDETFRELVVQMLVRAGHTPVVASNGFDALALFRAAPTDLVLTDIVMPYDGLAVIQILRAEFPKVGIIAMSGGGTFRLDYARRHGVRRTLMKPFTAEELAEAVAHALAPEAPGPPQA